MLRFIRDLVFPSAYDLSARHRRPAATQAGAQREGAEPVAASQPQAPATVSAKG